MKNKSKLNKRKEDKKNAGEKMPAIPSQWFYMNSDEISVKMIADACPKEDGVDVQIWEEICVLEVEIPERKSIDFQQIETDLGDEFSNAFLQEHQIRTLFDVTIDEENYVQVEKIFTEITAKLGGFFCGDTEDFEPFVK